MQHLKKNNKWWIINKKVSSIVKISLLEFSLIAKMYNCVFVLETYSLILPARWFKSLAYKSHATFCTIFAILMSFFCHHFSNCVSHPRPRSFSCCKVKRQAQPNDKQLRVSHDWVLLEYQKCFLSKVCNFA